MNTLIIYMPHWRENRHYSRKNVLFGPKFQLPSALFSEFATRWEVSHTWACSTRRVLSEYTSHTSGSFLELDPPWTKFLGVHGGQESTTPGHELEVMLIIFVVSAAEAFLRKISFPEKYYDTVYPIGVPNWDRLMSKTWFTLNNNNLVFNDGSLLEKNLNFHCGPLRNHDLEKLETSGEEFSGISYNTLPETPSRGPGVKFQKWSRCVTMIFW